MSQAFDNYIAAQMGRTEIVRKNKAKKNVALFPRVKSYSENQPTGRSMDDICTRMWLHLQKTNGPVEFCVCFLKSQPTDEQPPLDYIGLVYSWYGKIKPFKPIFPELDFHFASKYHRKDVSELINADGTLNQRLTDLLKNGGIPFPSVDEPIIFHSDPKNIDFKVEFCFEPKPIVQETGVTILEVEKYHKRFYDPECTYHPFYWDD